MGEYPLGNGASVPEERACGGCGQRLLDVFETSLQEAITRRRRANDNDDLSSDDEELGDRIWELIGSHPSKEEAIAKLRGQQLTLGRIYTQSPDYCGSPGCS